MKNDENSAPIWMMIGMVMLSLALIALIATSVGFAVRLFFWASGL